MKPSTNSQPLKKLEEDIRNNNDTDGIQFINIEVVRLDEITNADVGDDIIKDVVLEPKEKSSAVETAGGTPARKGRSRERSYHNKEVEHHPPNNSIFQRKSARLLPGEEYIQRHVQLGCARCS